jgi:hypothetical protein
MIEFLILLYVNLSGPGPEVFFMSGPNQNLSGSDLNLSGVGPEVFFLSDLSLNQCRVVVFITALHVS